MAQPMSPPAKVILKPRKAMPFFNRHPWVFAGGIARVEPEPKLGDVVDLFAHDGEFIARGLYNPTSQIRVRLFAWNDQTDLDRGFWSSRIDRAIALRKRLFPDAGNESAYRVVYSEADGLSGLIVDRYGETLCLQLTSAALATRKEMLAELLKEKLEPTGIWLRTEKGIRESEGLTLADGLLAGEPPPRPLFIEENGLRFGVDVTEGQKTGLYLDQRDNRAAVAQYVAGHRVLDLFCYCGAFGVAALKLGGAREVLGVDVSAPALALARENAALNGVDDRFRFEKAKAFEALEKLLEAGERFDTVILDPPKMTRHRAGLRQALRGYFSLNRMAVEALKPDGLLVTCSCSGLVSKKDFESMLSTVSVRTNRSIQILEARGSAADHPRSVHCPETDYLKCYICRVGS